MTHSEPQMSEDQRFPRWPTQVNFTSTRLKQTVLKNVIIIYIHGHIKKQDIYIEASQTMSPSAAAEEGENKVLPVLKQVFPNLWVLEILHTLKILRTLKSIYYIDFIYWYLPHWKAKVKDTDIYS